MVSRVGLVDRRRGDARTAVALEALLHLVGWCSVGRVGHEEVAVQRIAERGRLVVARDRLDRTLVVR